jgi:arylsulfatase A-like enzyme
MTLKLNGYSTAQFGKCHEVPVWQSSPMGPFDAWPSAGGGFETFTGSSVGRTTSGIQRSMTVRRQSSHQRLRKRVIT